MGGYGMSGCGGRADLGWTRAGYPLVTDFVEKGGSCDAEISVIQSV